MLANDTCQTVSRSTPQALLQRGIIAQRRHAERYALKDALDRAIITGLQMALDHITRAGRPFAPRVLSTRLLCLDNGVPAMYTMVIDPMTLWHKSLDDLLSPELIRVLTYQVGRMTGRALPVYAYEHKPGMRGGLMPGFVYAVPLVEIRPALPEPRAVELPKHVALDVTRRPSNLHVPIGMTADKPNGLWLPLAAMDGALIGGARGMGKSNLVHAIIHSLAEGRSAQMVLFDGKGGLEFNRYRGMPGVTVATDLATELKKMHDEMQRRMEILLRAGVVNLAQYNGAEKLPRVAIVIDELWYVMKDKPTAELLIDLAARGRCVGFHPIGATNQCRAEVVTPNLKVNLPTRIAFSVPQQSDSRVILDASDAASLPNIPGRCVICWQARMITAQAFEVELPPAPMPDATSAPSLTERELRIAKTVLVRGGVFKIGEIAADTGIRRESLVDLASDWERKGWLTTVQRSGNGNGGRKATDALIELVNLAE
jgi:hypothetical protein